MDNHILNHRKSNTILMERTCFNCEHWEKLDVTQTSLGFCKILEKFTDTGDFCMEWHSEICHICKGEHWIPGEDVNQVIPCPICGGTFSDRNK